MAFFACGYTIHFDDTMAYGSHHFLTSFKFQCKARETFLFGDRIFDFPGVKEALDRVHLLTSDAYARNLRPTRLGDRVAVLLTLEEWGRASARYCYRVIDANGNAISAGFQTLICADAESGIPMSLPAPLRDAMNAVREIEEVASGESFRDRVLAGGGKTEGLFGDAELDAAKRYLSERYPIPQVITATGEADAGESGTGEARSGNLGERADRDASDRDASDRPGDGNLVPEELAAWCFAGQGAFDAQLLSERVAAYGRSGPSCREQLERCSAIAGELLGGDSAALIGGSIEGIDRAVRERPELSQVAIHLQNVLGARLWKGRGHRPAVLMGHSFGEIAAFGEAGCFDLPTGVRIVCLRARCVREYGPRDGGLLAVFAERHRVRTEASLLGLHQVTIAGRNDDQQTVASGPLEQLRRLASYFRRVGVVSRPISSPTSFHHAQLRRAAALWFEEIRRLDFREPTVTLYSPIGRRFIKPNGDIPSILASQLLNPFDLQGSVWDVAAVGVTKFLDCGSSGSLARLLSKACDDELGVGRVGADDESGISRGVTGSGSTSTTEPTPATTEPTPAATEPTRAATANVPRRDDERACPEQETRVPGHANGAPAVAIVARGCILPGGAHSPKELLAAILEQRTGIVDQREHDPAWSEDFYSEKLVSDRSTSHLTGRVDEADIVPPPGVDPRVFETFSRAQRLLCIALAPCVASLEGAKRVVCLIGSTADGFEDQDESWSLVYAGIDPADPEVNRRTDSARSAYRMPHESIQEVFDRVVRPGCKVVLVDAACASSLYAVTLGMRLLESGEADAVIGGGCFSPGPGNSCLFSQFRGTTSTGCRPFDANADGVVFSEGAALVTLRRVSDAERSGIKIEAVVRGAGLSSDGRSTSANVPQSRGQLLSLRRCYAGYGIEPASIRAIEAHGTSTPIGDSTELETLRRFFAEQRPDPVLIHSLKGRLGHAGWAAGSASIIAVCEYLRGGVFPAQAGTLIPSEALKNSAATLSVPTHNVSLAPGRRRIALDGFGFGGANAHLVIESYEPPEAKRVNGFATPRATRPDDDLIFVACCQIDPTRSTPAGLRFDRERVELPPGYVVLPDLADEMDVSQRLTACLADRILTRLPNFDDNLRRDTSFVLAMNGKTERGIEATMRILASRLRRKLSGDDRLIKRLDAAYDRSRPSGPYTLQCMMPNVAAGRAALVLNLNGPNFVIDSGSRSLQSALAAAALLLRGGEHAGTRVAMVAAIELDVAGMRSCDRTTEPDESAAAFAVTTRRLAREYGWKELLDMKEVLRGAWTRAGDRDPEQPPAGQIRTLRERVEQGERIARGARGENRATNGRSSEPKPSAGSGCRIYTPVWVERGLDEGERAPRENGDTPLAAVVPADVGLVSELVAALPRFDSKSIVTVVGNGAGEVVKSCGPFDLIAVDLEDPESIAAGLRRVDDFQPGVIAAIQKPGSWDLSESLSVMAHENHVCEFLFLLAQRGIERLREGLLELWSLVVDGWSGVVHPQSGPVAGLLKSIGREIPAVRVGTLCQRGCDLDEALRSLFLERSHRESEPEVVYDGGTRLVRRLSPSRSPPVPTPLASLDSGSVVIATGGARGVTSVLLESLLRDHRCTVVALGRSSLESGPADPDAPGVEQQFYRRHREENPGATVREMKREFEGARARWETHKTLAHLQSLGGHVEYKSVDVTDFEQVSRAVGEVAARYGRVDFLIHGAGVQKSKTLADRTLAEFRDTYAVKVKGLDHLVKCCHAEFGKLVGTHVLTSAYSVFGNDGQHDYCAANEAMDRLCDLQGMREPAWSSIAWLAWDGIGMTRGSEYRVLSRQRGLSAVDAELGRRLFREVLRGRTDSAINVPLTESEHVKYQVKTVPATGRGENGTGRGENGTGRGEKVRVLEVAVDLSTVKCLPFHRVRDTPTLPGAWVLDQFVRAAKRLESASDRILDVTVRDLLFTRLVRDTGRHDPNVRVVAAGHREGTRVWMLADVLHPTGRVIAKDLICAQAELSFGREVRPLQRGVAEATLRGLSGSEPKERDPYCDGRSRGVSLSGPFDCLNEIYIGHDGRRATYIPSGDDRWSEQMPAMLLDAAWRVGAMHSSPEDDRLFVPVRIGKMVIPLVDRGRVGSIAYWEICSTRPNLRDDEVRWEQTVASDADGLPRMIIENAVAKRIT